MYGVGREKCKRKGGREGEKNRRKEGGGGMREVERRVGGRRRAEIEVSFERVGILEGER